MGMNNPAVISMLHCAAGAGQAMGDVDSVCPVPHSTTKFGTATIRPPQSWGKGDDILEYPKGFLVPGSGAVPFSTQTQSPLLSTLGERTESSLGWTCQGGCITEGPWEGMLMLKSGSDGSRMNVRELCVDHTVGQIEDSKQARFGGLPMVVFLPAVSRVNH